MRKTYILVGILAATVGTAAVALAIWEASPSQKMTNQERIDAADQALDNATAALRQAEDDLSELDAAGEALNNAAAAVEAAADDSLEEKEASPLVEEIYQEIFLREVPQAELREENYFFSFSYTFPAAVEENRSLALFLREDSSKLRRKWKKEAWEWYREGEDQTEAERRESRRFFGRDWELTADIAPLMSLSGSDSILPPAIHPNYPIGGIIWDTEKRKQIDFNDLFIAPGKASELITPIYCTELRREMASARGKNVDLTDIPESSCPTFTELKPALVAIGEKKIDRLFIEMDRNFDYPASHSLALPVTAELLALLKPRYREAFQVYTPSDPGQPD